jgi:REP element-mobilizing transposase RayT
MSASVRRLPHICPDGAWLFVTWHLHGSLPKARYPPLDKLSAGKAFVWMDRYLDTTRPGPMFLLRPDVARVVVEALNQGCEKRLYDLGAFAVLGNHVHVLIRPLQPASKLLQRLKGTTAREGNLILARTGLPFWQRESYDHWVRDSDELERIVAYIENNPVNAGLVAEPSAYLWSSACRMKPAAAR